MVIVMEEIDMKVDLTTLLKSLQRHIKSENNQDKTSKSSIFEQ